MKENDLEGILAIEKTSFITPWTKTMFREELSIPICVNRVAVAGDSIVGYSCFAIVFDESHLRNIAVHRNWRRKGVAECLLKDMICISIKRGACMATLEVRKSGIPAQRLYEKTGFRIAGLRPRYYSDTDEDALIMTVELQPFLSETEN
jgi:ribosomal-protein-alanine N-acetyltransferase